MVGIYKIECIVSNKFYIGSSIEIEKRWKRHLYGLSTKTHVNKHLLNSYIKYGISNFKFSIIEECDKSKLLDREQYWIDNLYPEFNIRKLAFGGPIGKKSSEYTKQLHRNNLSKTIHSEKAVLKRIEINKKQNYDRFRVEVLQYTKDGKFIQEFPSIKEAGDSLGLGPTQTTCIIGVCRMAKNRPTAYGYIWRYKNKSI
jgi:group I intron endonuclease